MGTLLARNADVLVTMDPARRELRGAGLYAVDGFIRQVGPTSELPATADVVLDLSGQIVLPGLINTHHHLNQTLTRAFPAAQDAGLFRWLTAQYPAWTRIDAEASRTSTLVGLAELLSVGARGCLAWAEPRKLVALIGVEDLVVVDTADALLVCPRDRAQDVKKIVDEIKARGRRDLL